VAGTGYAFVRAVDEHVATVHFPSAFTFAYVLQVVLAFGVLWELLEFALAGVATLAGVGSVLTQYGLHDTMLDLIFDTVGGILVAAWGTAHLTGVSGALAAPRALAGRRVDRRSASRPAGRNSPATEVVGADGNRALRRRGRL
jgi:hypothetical protein